MEDTTVWREARVQGPKLFDRRGAKHVRAAPVLLILVFSSLSCRDPYVLLRTDSSYVRGAFVQNLSSFWS